MTALPTQSAILGGGFSPWQAPIAALFSGISAAAQPGGWTNFAGGVNHGLQAGQARMLQMEQLQRAREQHKMEQERFAAEQRRANQEETQRQALIQGVNNLLAPQPVAASLGGPGVQTASASAIMNEYAGVPPHARRSAILSMGADMSRPGGATPQDAEVNRQIESGIGAGPLTVAPNDGLEILGRRYTPAQVAALQSMAANDPEGVMRILQEGAFAEPEEFDPDLTTFYEGDQQYQGYLGPDNKPVRVTPNAPRWAPKPEGGGLSVDINGDGVPDIQMGNIKSEWQSKDNAFANRLDNAIVEMDTVEAEGYDPTATTAGGVADYVGQRSVGGLIGNVMTSDQGKRWYRSAKEALAVFLRKDSGAAVTDEEFQLYGPIYLPMPWDDPKTKSAKKQAMLVMRNSLRQGLGQTQAPQPVAPAGAPTVAPSGGNPDDPLNMFPQQ